MGYLVPKRPTTVAVQQLLEAATAVAARAAIDVPSTSDLASKADAASVTSALAAKADAAATTAALAAKADTSALTSGLAAKLTTPTGAANGKLLGYSAGAPAWVDAPAGGGGTGIGNTFTVVQTLSGQTWSWSSTPAQIAAARTAGAIVQWMWRNADGAPYPQAADGITAADVINGTPPIVVSISGAEAPVATDAAGTSGDSVTLTKVTGVAWVVAGVTYKSSAMAAATQSVPYSGGDQTIVTAIAEGGYLIDAASTRSWTLTFTNVHQGVLTSEDFNRTDGAIGTAAGSFTTNAALGGTAVATCFATAAGTAIIGNQLGFTAGGTGLVIPLPTGPSPTSASLTFKAAALAAVGTGGLQVAVRASDGNSAIGVKVQNGQLWYYTYQVGGSVTATTGPAVAAGDTVRLDVVQGYSADAAGVLTVDATKCAVRIYRNGGLVQTYNATGTASFGGAYFGCVSGSTGFGRIDDVMIQVPAVA